MASASETKAAIWLNTAQQQHLHWSTMITALMGFTIVVVAGIWSYLMPNYIEVAAAKPAYLLAGAAASSLLLMLWRMYTHYLDNIIAGLYPELVY